MLGLPLKRSCLLQHDRTSHGEKDCVWRRRQLDYLFVKKKKRYGAPSSTCVVQAMALAYRTLL